MVRLLSALLLLAACGDDTAAPDAAVPDAAVVPDAVVPDALPPRPTLSDIGFAVSGSLPAGEQLLFNDWDATPNAVISLSPDGATATPIFVAGRVWSLGVRDDGGALAFSTTDPDQAAHYPCAFSDAIQHTWLYTPGASAELIGFGNVNDECHTFGPGGGALYVCRRYDFAADGSFKGWRLGRIDLPGDEFTFLTPDVVNQFHLYPQPTADGAWLYYTVIDVIPPSSQTRKVVRLALPPSGADPELVQANASGGALSPAGTHLAFSDWSDGRRVHVRALDGSTNVRVTSIEASTYAFSPDGARLAYLADPASAGCDSIYVVHTDGSDVAAPTQLRDCAASGEFITQLEWIAGP